MAIEAALRDAVLFLLCAGLPLGAETAVADAAQDTGSGLK
jgi:hypothetical protein